MLDIISEEHLRRLKDAIANTFTLGQLADWIQQYTFLDGKRFSFKDHEFQRDIVGDTAPTSIVVKCAQVGLSEIFARWTLAACVTQDNFTAIYTFPTTNDAEKFCKTRMDPCIQVSPELRRAIAPGLNNSEIKQFNLNSFLYFKGTISETGGLSVPADVVIHDEVDKSNLAQMSVYVSRLQHKPTKLRKLFSTPTVDKYGISKEAETAKRMRHMWKCSHCNHYFLPDYFDDIKIPGYNNDKREITKQNIKDIRWQEAIFLCPSCGKPPSPEAEFREWVCENSFEDYQANAWFVTPFSAPKVLTPSYLVNNSTQYEKYSEFMNQGLGLTAEDKNESITEADVVGAILPPADHWSTNLHYLGADMGMTCTISIGRPLEDGTLLVVHRETCSHTNFERRRDELCVKYRVSVSVHDAQPYVDMITRLCNRDPNAYAAVFTTGYPGAMYLVKHKDENAKEGTLNMRRLNVTHTLAFDTLMGMFKRNQIKVQRDENVDEDWKQQIRSLKRVAKFDRLEELIYQWVKTDKNDHYHFSLLYLMLACDLRGITGGQYMPGTVPIVSSFRVKQR